MARSKSAPKPSVETEARAAIKRLISRSGGMALIGLSLLGLISLVTFDVSDPSLSTSTGRDFVTNSAGPLGAVFADLVLQMLGGAGFTVLLILGVWGVDAVVYGTPNQTPLSAWLKAAALPLGAVLFGGFASCLPRSIDWPFVVGFGGLFGDLAAGGLSGLLGALHIPAARMVSAAMLLLAGASLLAFAGGTRWAHVVAAADAVRYSAEVTWAALQERWEEFREGREAGESLHELPPLTEEDAEEVEIELEGDAELAEEYEYEYEEEDGYEYEYEDEEDGFEEEVAEKARIVREPKKVPPRKRPTITKRRAGEAYEFPGIQLLKAPTAKDRKVLADKDLEERAQMLERVLADFKIGGEITGVRPGPVVTLYELKPAAGTKSSRVIALADDIARSMSAVACRVAVVPGRNAIGIELPNDDREMVYFREMLTTDDFADAKNLTIALGKDIGGEPQYADLSKMPHLLIAGTTGSGKSVGINTMILSLLYRLPPEECKMIMVDPKMLELSVYEGIPHLLAPVVTEPRKAVVALKWTVREMEERYRRMSKVGVRNITGFNERVADSLASGEPLVRKVHSGYDPDTGEPTYEEEVLDEEKMPYIVVVIDEVADLMMVAGKDIEAMVQRLAQMARAAGIHLIMATQRPSVDVITGTIKANFPTRISFQVTSKIDSRTILGEQGAEQLLGQGDMLFMAGGGRLTRVHGGFVSDDEVEKIVTHLKKQGKPDYIQEVTEGGDADDMAAAQLGLDLGGNTGSGDALFDQAVAIVVRDRKASTSYLQRRLQIGYNRAATLIEKLEDEGIISQANHAGKREVLIGEDAA
ncbi:MAG: DNA translocase FtsK 4TM domain-containing protein [Pseudomonadota bacterium]